MKLYTYPKSRGQRPHWLLEELEVPFEKVNIDLSKGQHRTPEYQKIHPLGLVPAFQDGDKTLFESVAMVTYLADRFPDKKMAPNTDSPERADYYNWIFFAVGTLENPIVNIFYHTQMLPEEKRNAALVADSRTALVKTLPVIEKHLSQQEYFLKSGFSAVDVIMGSLLGFAQGMGAVDHTMSAIQSYIQRCKERPAYQRAIAS